MAYTFKVVKRDGEHFLNVMEVGNVVFGGYLGFMNDLKQYSYRHKLNCIDIDGDIWLDGDTMIKVYKWLKCEDKSFLSSLRKLGVYSTKRRLNQTHRIHVMYTQKYRCAICTELLKPTCELDHIVSLEEGGKEFANNMRNYYHYAATNDKILTHSLLNPTVNFELSKQGKSDKDVSLKVVKENDAGIFVSGARLLATLGPQADEVEVFPSTLLNRQKGSDLEYAFAFVAPVASPGLRMICRDTYDHAKSHYDAPLSSRYEEMDAVVIFKSVFVWPSLRTS